MNLLRLTGLLVLIGVLPDSGFVGPALAAQPAGARTSDGTMVSLDVHQPESMLDCARLTDVAKKLRCFDRAKSSAPDVAEPEQRSQRQADGEPQTRSLDTDRTGSPSSREPAAIDSAPGVPKSKKKAPAEILSDYVMEVVRQLGKEMRPEEYPAHAREQGIGGTVHALLHIGTDGRVADTTVASSSGNDELDQYVVDKLSRLRLPRIPPEFRARAFAVQIPVKFAVRGN